MCLYGGKIRINIFPKTVYKIVNLTIDPDIVTSYFQDFIYVLNKKYKINIKDIINNRLDYFNRYLYFIGFHSYTNINFVKEKNNHYIGNNVIVKCKIPAFSFIIKGIGRDKNEILSNRIIITEINPK